MFQFTRNNVNSTLLVEEVNYSFEELLNIVDLNKEDETQFLKFNNTRRKKEWLSVRYLLNKACKTDVTIQYNNDGKPSLSNGKNISISHSGNYVGIIISENKDIGLDIEKISNKLEKIKHKYLNNFELDIVENSVNRTETLAIFWCAKEAMYKLYAKKNLIFDGQLLIKKIDFVNQKIFADIKADTNKKLELSFKKINDYYLVWIF
jgi:phosphopantetheinyl transferase